jgi:hypothetical protein
LIKWLKKEKLYLLEEALFAKFSKTAEEEDVDFFEPGVLILDAEEEEDEEEDEEELDFEGGPYKS